MHKVAVITGSSGDIGRALIAKYESDNYLIVALDRAESKIKKSEKYVPIEIDLCSFAKNITYRNDMLEVLKSTLPTRIEKFILINNAAEQIVKALIDLDWQDWETSFAVNAAAPFFLTQGLLDIMKKTKSHVINVSSIHSLLTKPKFAYYAASKSALNSITRSLAIELSPLGISVNAVAPAAISTEMLRAGFKDHPEKLGRLESYHPSNTIGTPEELSGFIKSLTDHEGSFLTGAVLDFNGGIGGRLFDP